MPLPTLINLDHNATTAPRPEVLNELCRVAREAAGNPGSRHALGRKARQCLEEARERLAALLGARPVEVVFTSGGTESINLALSGLSRLRDGSMAAPPGEHPATEELLRGLEGRPRLTLPIEASGCIARSRLAELPWDEVGLATLLLAHNETGVVQDVEPVIERCRASGIPVHLDAVQAVGKIDVDFRRLGATALSLAGHKFHGPRGIGAVLIREGVELPPLLRGGHQERGRRPGTECVSLAAGMVLALELWHRDRERITEHLQSLRERLWERLQASCAPVRLIGHAEQRLPNTLNVAFPGVDGEALLVSLDLAGVCASLGTTCASGTTEPSPILSAMGVPAELHRSCLRLSLGRDNTREEVDEAAERIAEVVRRLRAAAGGSPSELQLVRGLTSPARPV